MKSISNPQTEIFLERGRISIYYLGDLNVNYVVNNTPGTKNGLILLIIVLLVAGAAYFYRNKFSQLIKPKIIYKRAKPKKKWHIVDIVRQILNPREQLILDTLGSTGRVKMSHLRKLTEIPKASFSRHIQELERKKLVMRSGEGKNKFVELVK